MEQMHKKGEGSHLAALACTPGMGDSLEVKVLCGRWFDEPLAKGNCASVSERGEEAQRQNLDSMDKNCVTRHRVRGKLARDGEAQTGPKQLYVNAARIKRKLSHLIRGDLSSLRARQKSAKAVVVDGVTTIRGGRGNPSTGRRAERLRS